MSVCIGIDFGGSSIKAARVNTADGTLLGQSRSVPTPKGGALQASLEAMRELVGDWPEPIGIAFPSVVLQGRTWTAANIGAEWIGADAASELKAVFNRPIALLNDADAAGLAEMRLGSGVGLTGAVLMLTFGTGIGSALFINGVLWPNTELGHLVVDGVGAEVNASAKARARDGLSFEQWAVRVDRVLAEYQKLLWPEVVIVGGGISEHFEQFSAHLKTRVTVIPAQLRQDAGIVGAALAAGSC